MDYEFNLQWNPFFIEWKMYGLFLIYQWSNNIISTLGFTTEENYTAVKQGNTGLNTTKSV